MTITRQKVNVTPIVLTIVNTAENARLEEGAHVVNAAVHGRMEGHLAAPGHQIDRDNVGEMP